MTEAATIGVDLGGTKTAAALVLPGGDIELCCTAATPAGSGPIAMIDNLSALVTGIRHKAAQSGLPAPVAIGIGSAGVIDSDHGMVLSATHNLSDWGGTPLAELVSARTGLPVRAINDVHAHAIGEATYGAARGLHSVLMVAVGTGVGGSFILDGAPLGGARHAAGHLGHTPVPEAEGLLCTCGRTGHLEAIASGTGLLALHRRRGGAAPDTRRIVMLAESGDPVALECLTVSATALGRAIGGWVNLLDPDAVILSGGLAESGQLWWSAVTDAANREYIDAVAGCPLLPAQRGAHAAILGAAAYARAA
ncbi:ROK family protein [Mycobacterium sp. 21AC1]|uniref:ROK family protein n=1 Tax=[Mycobacterium] appelbergii TaxID=2939269 RepID=UPI002939141F|nr:ROK family protein [Mycobacterium sp. 21AC1]MDV3124162.1 ROK family protein [Mycobacterium sp. 21AC1]